MRSQSSYSKEFVEQFAEQGFLVIEDFIGSSVISDLRHRASELVRQAPRVHATVFAEMLKNGHSAQSNYILDSADKINYFFEDLPAEHANEPALCKLGHALHDVDPVFNRFSRNISLLQLSRELGFSNPLLAQSMYFFMRPRVGSKIDCHQDASFILTVPSSVVGFWFALEDTTVANGCLQVLPGGHRGGLKRRFISTPSNQFFTNYDESPFDLTLLSPLEVKKGSLVVLHGLLPHFSGANTSHHSREAYVIHIIEGNCIYPDGNWLQRPASNPFTGFHST